VLPGKFHGVMVYRLLLAATLCLALAVDQSKFRTCHQTGFCDRQRSASTPTTYSISSSTVSSPTPTTVVSSLTKSHSSNHAHSAPHLSLSISAYQSTSVFRVKLLDDQDQPAARWVYNSDRKLAHDDTTPVLEHSLALDLAPLNYEWLSPSKEQFSVTFATHDQAASSSSSSSSLLVTVSPFRIDLIDGGSGATLVTLNADSLLHFDDRAKSKSSTAKAKAKSAVAQGVEAEIDRHNGKKITGYWEDGLAIYEDGSRELRPPVDSSDDGDGDVSGDTGTGWGAESFGSHKDPKKMGDSSLGVDISFPG